MSYEARHQGKQYIGFICIPKALKLHVLICLCENVRIIAHSIQKHWNRRSIQRFLDFSHDKEHDHAKFLQIGVSIAKLPPLLYHCKVFIKCIFVLSCIALIYAADFSMRHYSWFSHVGSDICVL